MTSYEKALDIWHSRNITTEAELAEALNSHSIAFAFHSGKIETTISLTMIPGKSSSMTASPLTPGTCGRCLKSETRKKRTNCF